MNIKDHVPPHPIIRSWIEFIIDFMERSKIGVDEEDNVSNRFINTQIDFLSECLDKWHDGREVSNHYFLSAYNLCANLHENYSMGLAMRMEDDYNLQRAYLGYVKDELFRFNEDGYDPALCVPVSL